MKRILYYISITFISILLTNATTACSNSENEGTNVTDNKYYIDPDAGDDKNDGKNQTSAWKSLKPLSSRKLKGGDFVYIRGGKVVRGKLTFKGSGDIGNPITITSYGEGKGIIDGYSEHAAIYLINQSNIIISNLEIKNTVDSYSSSTREQRNGIYVHGLYGIISNITITSCYIHDVFGTVIRPFFYDNAGINFRYKTASDSRNKFDNILIENTIVEDVRSIGIRIGDGIEEPSPHSTNFVVRNTTIRRTGADGIIVQACYKPLVEHTKCFDAGYHAVMAGWETGTQCIAAMWSCSTESPVWQYNEIARTRFIEGDGQAFDADWGTSGTPVWQYNYIHDNEGGVMLRHEDFKGIFRYNISVNDGLTINGDTKPLIFHSSYYPSGGGEKTLFYNNIFYNYKNDLIISKGYKEYPDIIMADTKNNEFINNIFVFNNNVDFGQNTVFENNCYFNPIGAETSYPHRDVNNVVGSPLFSGELPSILDGANVGSIFKLLSGSPCINAGKYIENNGGFDFVENSLPLNKVSIGPIEN